MEPKDVTILVVDDVNAIRVQVKDLLKGLGYRSVVVASSGEEAKEILQSQPIHLILCDWQMTPTSGIDLLKHCRSTIDHCDIAFIMVTAISNKWLHIGFAMLLGAIAAVLYSLYAPFPF